MTSKLRFRIASAECVSCSRPILGTLRKLPQVESAAVAPLLNMFIVEYDESKFARAGVEQS
ncbi:MAG: hypothetical protein QXI37_04080, partial [Thermoprotei archaeon]